jgi:hypothetical protein
MAGIVTVLTTQSEVNMSYGKIISGGKPMTKGLTNINEKREEFAENHKRSAIIATSVNNAFKQTNLSEPTTGRDVKGGSFLKAKARSNV